MSSIEVFFTVKDKTIKEKFERELKWYDPIKREMQFFTGGKLIFEYREDEYLVKMGEIERKSRGISNTSRLLPKVTDLKIYAHKDESNKDSVKKWYRTYLNYNNSSSYIQNMGTKSIEFFVPDEEVDEFSDDLDRRCFEYRI